MSQLPDPTCADCVAFNPETRDDRGKLRGPCRFRPEMHQVPEDLPYCSAFAVKLSRKDKVNTPGPSKARHARGGGHAPRQEPRPQAPLRRTLERPTAGDTSGEITMDRDGLKQVLRELLEEETLFGYPEMGARWEGGTMVLNPGVDGTQPKEIPLETFFHKIVMLRDRLRVLEAKVNGHDALSERDRVELQAYISKCYGTLTTFNVLFRDKKDQFSTK